MGYSLMRAIYHGLLAFGLALLPPYKAVPAHTISPPGSYHVSWVGNSFGGSGARPGEGVDFPANGYGYWVQDSVGVIAVAPDGTVFNNIIWDEGGRGLALYKDGRPNRVPVVARSSQPMNQDFNTSGHAVCVDRATFYLGNSTRGNAALGDRRTFPTLSRFSWTPGDINSTHYVDQVRLSQGATSLSCARGKILVGLKDKIELREEGTMRLLASYPYSGVTSVLLSPDGSFWIIADGKVRHLRADGSDTGVTLSGIGDPTSLAWANNGNLIVTDNGPRQQVLFFDISGKPKLVSTFGVKGGLYSGVPGAVAPQKLFGLRGAGMDSHGNLYVGMSFAPGATGNAFIRAFSPSGKLLWHVDATAFVDTFGFQPGSDGTVVFGRTTQWKLHLDRHKPGSEQQLVALTVDPFKYPDDPRIKGVASVEPRLIDGKQLLYVNAQYGGKLDIYAGAPGTDILHLVATTPKFGWAWSVTDNGDIWTEGWHGRTIDLFHLQSVNHGVPVYDWKHPRTWPVPADFGRISRVIYDPRTDSLYLFGFLKSQDASGWLFALGRTARRYDGWLAGTPRIRWTNSSLPTTIGLWRLGGSIRKSLLPPKDVSLAGNYLFFGMIRDLSPKSEPRVSILDAATGKYVGTMLGGPVVGDYGGVEDMVGSIHATRRNNGEYLVLVEEDARAKNILFRWNP